MCWINWEEWPTCLLALQSDFLCWVLNTILTFWWHLRLFLYSGCLRITSFHFIAFWWTIGRRLFCHLCYFLEVLQVSWKKYLDLSKRKSLFFLKISSFLSRQSFHIFLLARQNSWTLLVVPRKGCWFFLSRPDWKNPDYTWEFVEATIFCRSAVLR